MNETAQTDKQEDPRGGRSFGLCMLPRNATVGWGARFIIQKNWLHNDWERKVERREAVRYANQRGAGGLRGRPAVKRKLPKVGREPKRYVVDFVWDRQDMYGLPEEREAFKKVLNKGGKTRNAVAKAIKEVERLFDKPEWNMMSSSPRTLFRDERLVIVGDPRGSGGYVYVVAYPAQPEG